VNASVHHPQTLVRCLSAFGLGVLGDTLLRATPWGINFTIGAGAAAVAATWLGPSPSTARRDVRALAWAGAAMAIGVAWREAELLTLANVAAVGGLFILALVRARGLRLETAGVRRYVAAGVAVAVVLVRGALPVLAMPLPASPGGGRRLREVAIGAVLALPVLIVFGMLLASADPVFERVARSVFAWDTERVVSHVGLITIFTWLAMGFLVALNAAGHPDAAPGDEALTLVRPLGIVEIGIPLGTLAALFAVFAGIQAGYLFGGDAIVQARAGLGYADYARRGFFELVTVTVLVMPLLLAADGLLDRGNPSVVRGFRALATILLALLSLIVVSAGYRLWLYFVAYGMTSDRVYAAATMVWVAAALAWFSVTVLRGRRGPFALGAGVAALGVLVALNVINPDAVVARVNVARAQSGAELDLQYLAGLSGDGLPALSRAAAALGPDARCRLAADLEPRWRDTSGDWRTWNLGRARARAAVLHIGTLCAQGPAVQSE
jgi:hypothetical protein